MTSEGFLAEQKTITKTEKLIGLINSLIACGLALPVVLMCYIYLRDLSLNIHPTYVTNDRPGCLCSYKNKVQRYVSQAQVSIRRFIKEEHG